MNRPTAILVTACACLSLLVPPARGQVVVEESTVRSTAVADDHSHDGPAAAAEKAIKPSPHVLTQPKVAHAAFSPDGKVLLTIGEVGGQVHFWSVENGEELNRFGVAVSQAIFSADGSRVLTWSKDGVARVFDSKTGKALRRLEGARDVRAMAIAPDGATAATAEAWQNPIRIWDTKTGQPTGALEGQTAPASTLAFTPDGRQLLALAGSHLRLFDVANGKEARKIDLPPPTATGAYLSKNGKLALVAWPTTNKIYDLSTGEAVPAPRTPDEYFPPGQTAGNRKTGLFRGPANASIVDALTGEPVRPLDKLDAVPLTNAFSADGARVVIGGGGGAKAFTGRRMPTAMRGKVYVYDVATGKQLAAYDGHPREVHRVGFSPDGTRAFSLDAGHTLFLWAVPAAAAAK